MLVRLGIIVFLAISCSDNGGDSRRVIRRSQPATSSNSTGLAGKEFQLDLETWKAIETLNEHYSRLRHEEVEYQKLKVLNETLCKRLEKTRIQCLTKKPLMPNSVTKLLACDGSYEDTELNSEITVMLTTYSTANFKLVANDNYESSPFKAGTSTITFTTLIDDDKKSPTFSSVHKLVLKADNENQPANSRVDILIKIDGAELLTQTVSNSAKAPSEFPIDLTSIFELNKSPSCRMSDEEFERITKLTAEKIEPASSEELAIDPHTLTEVPTLAEIEQKQQAIDAELAKIHPIIEPARDRSFRLRSELMTATDAGCHLREPIETLAIEIEGQPRGRAYRGKYADKQSSPTEAVSSVLQIDLGNLRFEVDLAVENIFGVHHNVKNDFSNEDIIGGIDRIILAKKGVKYDSLAEPCNTDSGIFSSIKKIFKDKTCYRVHEEDIIMISSVKLFANGKLIFSDNKLDVTLKNGQQTWAYAKNLQSNPQWVKEILQTNDCNSTR